MINVLALRPGGNLADTRAEIAALDRVDRFAWDLPPLMVWPGTQLASDLATQKQLAGKGAGLTWRPAEPAAERFLFALNRLRVGGLTWLMRKHGGQLRVAGCAQTWPGWRNSRMS